MHSVSLVNCSVSLLSIDLQSLAPSLRKPIIYRTLDTTSLSPGPFSVIFKKSLTCTPTRPT